MDLTLNKNYLILPPLKKIISNKMEKVGNEDFTSDPY